MWKICHNKIKGILLLIASTKLYSASFNFLKIDPDPLTISSQCASIAVSSPHFAKNPVHYAAYRLSLHKRKNVKEKRVLKISLTSCNWLVGSNIFTLNSFYKFRNYVIGANIFYLDFGNFSKRDSMGNLIGSFTANAGTISPFFVYFFNNIAIGGRLGYAFERICDVSAFTIFMDFGIAGMTEFKNYNYKIIYHLGMKNLGLKVKFENEKSFIPFELLTGACIYKTKKLVYSVNLLLRDDTNLSFGIDYRIHKLMNLRVGYVIGQDFGLLSGLRMGFRIRYRRYFCMDYAMLPLGPFGYKHVIGITYWSIFD